VTVSERVSAIGGVLILLVALLSAVGAPPSELRQDPTWVARVFADYLFVLYGGGVLLALVGVTQSAIGSPIGRWSSTSGGVLIVTANLAAAGIAAPREASVAAGLAGIVAVLVPGIWVPYGIARVQRPKEG
jgi:hypothetical protein